MSKFKWHVAQQIAVNNSKTKTVAPYLVHKESENG